ncbi:UDP-4-amino-4,6-dideoxy-N-acetyl-beta-L-altrosamine N-acetyltransferase [uncultured Cohaesibacter sp.]|uniref:UDP-4-amino-4, 6-dideoxy-N-acetyl-beta-L-altrosamine N-acetyltransferase n=1 Tax=uncultured Cohaesibacter sp. TaxID=1002546 RepID=UPI002AA8EB01|nr:UDP-4-amino-4,6-dideoxy-N-acetyl-beta-L-altrosamine N-acetyltransferase [uncultured Cohaesibacter sp.]
MHTERVRPMEAGDLKIVLAWRNHAEVRNYMFAQEYISFEQHKKWFDMAHADPTRALLIYERDGVDVGFVQFSNVEPGSISEWGFYKAPSAPKGTGRALGAASLTYAFDELHIHKACGQVLDFNIGSIKMHLSLGFKQEGLLRDQHRLNSRYHAVFQFGLFTEELKAALK